VTLDDFVNLAEDQRKKLEDLYLNEQKEEFLFKDPLEGSLEIN
jgi:hypothetical protein